MLARVVRDLDAAERLAQKLKQARAEEAVSAAL
jgi:hypothetical protein